MAGLEENGGRLGGENALRRLHAVLYELLRLINENAHELEHPWFRDALAKDAYLSKGSNLAAVRFYFADAAGEGYLGIANPNNNAIDKLSELAKKVAIALYQIVLRFTERRAGGLYKVPRQNNG